MGHREETTLGISKCPDCGGNVSTRATACPHCGAPVPHESGTESSSPTQASIPNTQLAHPAASDDYAFEIVLRPRLWYLLAELKSRAGLWVGAAIVVWFSMVALILGIGFVLPAVVPHLASFALWSINVLSLGFLLFLIRTFPLRWMDLRRSGARISLSFTEQSLVATFDDSAALADFGIIPTANRVVAYDRSAIRAVEISKQISDFGRQFEWGRGWPEVRQIKVNFDSDRGRVGQILFHVDCLFWRFDETSQQQLHTFVEHIKSSTDFTWTEVRAKPWQRL